MTPTEIEIQNPVTGQTETRTIIGVIDSRVSRFFGIYMSQEALGTIFEQPTLVRYFVQLAPEVDSRQAAHDIEAALMPFGAQADATAAILERQNSQTRGFLYLFEGFMALGLVVGIAALGVISFRAVVERRQQIGMLRAIGYRRAMVAASFVLESTIVTALGVLSGLALGLFLSWQLMSSEEFAGTVSGGSFIWPWGQVLVFAGIAMVASLVMAYIPARQAARVPIAESLRYE